MKWLQKWRERRRQIKAVADLVRERFPLTYPDEKLMEVKALAVEEDRIVIAAVLAPPWGHKGMPPYRVLAVSKDLRRCEELPKSEEYRLRGTK